MRSIFATLWIFVLVVWVFSPLGVMSQGSAAKKGDAIKGRKVYRAYCTSCHGYNARGDGPLAEYVEIAPRDHTDGRRMNARTDEHLFKTIHDGGPANDFSVNMPIWGKALTEEQIWEIIAYLRSIHLSPADIFPKAESFRHELLVLNLDELYEVEEQSGQTIEVMIYRAYLYFPSATGKQLGVASFGELLTTVDDIESVRLNVGIGIDAFGKIVSVRSLDQHKELGKEGTFRFLKQFTGFSAENRFTVGQDVQAIEGHEDVCQQLADEIKKLYFLTVYAANG